jgi:hypothetical protein
MQNFMINHKVRIFENDINPFLKNKHIKDITKNDILQINKIEENRVVLESMTFNIYDEIEMIIRSLSFLSQNNNYFGVKAGSSWKGPTVMKVDDHNYPEAFRVYGSVEE